MAPIPFNRMYIMNRPDVRPSPRPFIVDSCQSELNKLFPTAHQQVVLKAQIQKRINFFQDHLTNFAQAYPLFEFYDNYSDQGTPLPIYVMRFNKSKDLGNLRIFFIIFESKMYLLHAFLEKGKKAYAPAYEVVKKRLSKAI